MNSYLKMTKEELLQEKQSLEAEYKKIQDLGLNLNMARGKPSVAQLELSMPMMDTLHSEADMVCEDGSDCRNYGVPVGIPEARRLMGSMSSYSEIHPSISCMTRWPVPIPTASAAIPPSQSRRRSSGSVPCPAMTGISGSRNTLAPR